MDELWRVEGVEWIVGRDFSVRATSPPFIFQGGSSTFSGAPTGGPSRYPKVLKEYPSGSVSWSQDQPYRCGFPALAPVPGQRLSQACRSRSAGVVVEGAPLADSEHCSYSIPISEQGRSSWRPPLDRALVTRELPRYHAQCLGNMRPRRPLLMCGETGRGLGESNPDCLISATRTPGTRGSTGPHLPEGEVRGPHVPQCHVLSAPGAPGRRMRRSAGRANAA